MSLWNYINKRELNQMTLPNKSVHTGMVTSSSPAVKGHKRQLHTGARLVLCHNGGCSSIYAHPHAQLTFNILFLQAVTINLPIVVLRLAPDICGHLVRNMEPASNQSQIYSSPYTIIQSATCVKCLLQCSIGCEDSLGGRKSRKKGKIK